MPLPSPHPQFSIADRLPHRWFARPATVVARSLLGCQLARFLDDGTLLLGRIVETEAYVGVQDRASHAYAGRRTPRNEAMYAAAGTSYVYFTYGMHFCFNVVTGQIDEPAAVLIRALEPTLGLDAMRAARAAGSNRLLQDRHLCSGPAKLCQALQIDRSLNQVDLPTNDRITILKRNRSISSRNVTVSPRIGIPNSGEWTAQLLRWHIESSEHVSKP